MSTSIGCLMSCHDSLRNPSWTSYASCLNSRNVVSGSCYETVKPNAYSHFTFHHHLSSLPYRFFTSFTYFLFIEQYWQITSCRDTVYSFFLIGMYIRYKLVSWLTVAFQLLLHREVGESTTPFPGFLHLPLIRTL